MYLLVCIYINIHRQQDSVGCEEAVFQAARGGVQSDRHGPQVPGPGWLPTGPPGNTDEDERHPTSQVSMAVL